MNITSEASTTLRFPLHTAPVAMPAIKELLHACVKEQAPSQDWLIDLIHGWAYSLLQSEQAHAHECAEQLVAALSPQFSASAATGVHYRADAGQTAPCINTLALATLVDQCQYGVVSYQVAFAALVQYVNHWGASLMAANGHPVVGEPEEHGGPSPDLTRQVPLASTQRFNE